MNLAFEACLFRLRNDIITCHKILQHGDRRLYFPSEGRRAADFYRPLKSIASAGFEPVNFGSSDKDANHYTTDAT
jgi:hypothetical protein